MKKFFFYLSLGILFFLLAQAAWMLSFQPLVHQVPLPANCMKGVYHLHSSFSDGRGDIAAITAAARKNRLQFVILTDHGRPNLSSSRPPAWENDVLLIGGSEFSTDEGHLAAVGYRVPEYIFPPEARAAAAEVERDMGVSFAAHPFDKTIPWTDWDVPALTGLELLSVAERTRASGLPATLLTASRYLLSPPYALTAILRYPTREMAVWDRLCASRPLYGIYALDAHGKIPLSKKSSLHFPSYANVMKSAVVYVRLPGERPRAAAAAAAAVIHSLRRGAFFNCIETIAAADGFDMYLLSPDGRRIEMGGQSEPAAGTLVFRLPFPFATRVRVLRNGQTWREFRENTRNDLTIPLSAPGVYRAEIYARESRFSELPWIVTNPFFVGPRPERPAPPPPPPVTPLALDGLFQVEKNPRSQGELTAAVEDGAPILRFRFRLEREDRGIDFWSALAHRAPLSLAGARGLALEVRADHRRLFWLQTRNDGDESRFRRSFVADTQWQTVYIPMQELHRIQGDRPRLDAGRISALFLLIDNSCAYARQEGVLEIRLVGTW